MKPRGHWWCERCQDVVHQRADETEPTRCQGCNRNSAVFIPDNPTPIQADVPASAESARAAFAAMHQVISKTTGTP